MGCAALLAKVCAESAMEGVYNLRVNIIHNMCADGVAANMGDVVH
jgi:hypothetical protein